MYSAQVRKSRKQLIFLLRKINETKYLLPKEDASVMKLIKAADKISALIKCIEEEKTGNREFNHAKESTFKAIRELECKEAEIFCEEFVPEYEKTLDELN